MHATPDPSDGQEVGEEDGDGAAETGRGGTARPEWLAPLASFYARSALSLPPAEPVAPDELPPAARTLLVHDSDMTSTLRRFHGAAIGLRVCAVTREGDELGRLVVLFRVDTGRPVEFGAIRIRLDRLPAEIRDRVVEGSEPLGGILEQFRFPFRSRPRGFFRFDADPFIGVLLAQPIRHRLFGRCNVLADGEGEPFAEIVEILPEEGEPS